MMVSKEMSRGRLAAAFGGNDAVEPRVDDWGAMVGRDECS